LLGANRSANAARDAANSQSASAAAGIAEQRRQFDSIQQMLAPFVGAGTDALSGLLDFSGLNGQDAQAAAIGGVENSAEYASQVGAAENAMLQNTAATGGLRGGNTQRALAEVRPTILNGLVNQQYGRLGGLATMGQSSAVQTGTAGQNMAGQVSNLYAQQGAAQAGGALGQAAAFNNGLAAVGNAGGQYFAAMQQAQNQPLFGGNSWGF
jgi:hypothetical protein